MVRIGLRVKSSAKSVIGTSWLKSVRASARPLFKALFCCSALIVANLMAAYPVLRDVPFRCETFSADKASQLQPNLSLQWPRPVLGCRALIRWKSLFGAAASVPSLVNRETIVDHIQSFRRTSRVSACTETRHSRFVTKASGAALKGDVQQAFYRVESGHTFSVAQPNVNDVAWDFQDLPTDVSNGWIRHRPC